MSGVISIEFAANYRGDQSHAVGEVMGPNTMGEWFRVATATYDETTDRTRLTFTVLRPEEVHEALGLVNR